MELKKKFNFSIRTLVGVAICLFAIVGFLSMSEGVTNSGCVFLSYIFSFPIVYLFGFVGYWAFFPILLMFGIVILLRNKFETKHVNAVLLGLLFVFIAACIMCSQYIGNQYCKFYPETGDTTFHLSEFFMKVNGISQEEFASYSVDDLLNLEEAVKFNGNYAKEFYKELFSSSNKIPTEDGGNYIVGAWQAAQARDDAYRAMMNQYQLAGGFVGYAIAGALSSSGNWLTWVVSIIIVIAGLILVFHESIASLFGLTRANHKEKKQHKEKIEELSTSKYEIEEEHIEESEVQEERIDKVGGLYQKEKPAPIYETAPNIATDTSILSPDYDFEIKTFNKSHGLVKARFYEDNDPNKPVLCAPSSQSYSYYEENNSNSSIKNDFGEQFKAPKPYNEIIEEQTENNESSIEENNNINEYKQQINKPINNVQVAPVVNVKPIQTVSEINKPLEAYKNEFIGYEKEKGTVVEPAPIKVPHHYQYPTSDMLNKYNENLEQLKVENEECCESFKDKINSLFQINKVQAKVSTWTIGPSITRFDVEYIENGLASQVQKLEQDISIRLGGVPTRFTPLVLGKETSGLEVANKKRMTVSLRECIEQLPPRDDKNATMICYGKDISGNYQNSIIAKAPHVLIAGTTGSGKSVFAHSVITTLIMRNSPDELRLILVDPKRVEMLRYRDLPHLLCPIITDPFKAKAALDKLVKEMDHRYDLMASKGVNDIKLYNKIIRNEGGQIMPTIICFIDEFADLVDNCKDVSKPVAMLGAKSRACGIHVVIATQHPTVNVVNGTIKSNLPVRIGLSVRSSQDSSVILDSPGADKLLGNGDMLISDGNLVPNALVRCQGSYIDDDEAMNVIKFIKDQWEVEYDPFFLNLEEPKDPNEQLMEAMEESTKPSKAETMAMEDDELFFRIKDYAQGREFVSMSSIQRDFSVGFNRAGKMLNRLREEGVVAKVQEPGAKGWRVIMRGGAEASNNEGSNELVKEYNDDEEISN